MDKITHCHNERPIYELENRDVYEWDNPITVAGKEHTLDYPTYHPVIVDIETSAELGQRPILAVIYDSLGKDLIVLYTHGYQDYVLNQSKVSELIDDIDCKNIIVDNLSQSKFETYVLRRIHRWNKKAKERKDKNRKSLVAHNAAFDIPMLGSPDDGILDLDRIGDQYEMGVQYNDVKMVGHRAGQFGQIYQFLDSANHYNSMYIPVGDTMVTAQALWIPAGLKSACDKVDISLDVSESEVHGNLSDEYVKYCLNDVWATYKLYKKLSNRLQNMFGNFPIEHIYSTASIGKYVLKKMGYQRVGYEQNAVDRIAKAYFGGRTDAEVTGEIVDGLRYTDILSQYPTVSALTNVWDYMKCVYVSIEQIEPSELPKVEDLRDPESWKEIADYYVKIRPKGATLPVRTPHLDDTTKVVTSKVHSDKEIQYHYMDILASQLIDGAEKYEIVAAWKVSANGKQKLQDFEIGDTKISAEDNVMAKSIEERKNIQITQGYKDEMTLSLKITANSLYGVSAERIVKEVGEDKHDFASNSGFYNPHVAATITAGGRLMIALGEYRAEKYGGEMVYCDTDSLILQEEITDRVIQDFDKLNPYDGKAGELQVLEDEKGETGRLYATGTKKYVFFNDDGEVLEVKEHGLGNYENLRDHKTTCELWNTIMYYDTGEIHLDYYTESNGRKVDLNILYDKKLNENVFWSFNASTRSMRVMIDDMTNDFVRYGDWLQSTISYDDSIRYMALNLDEKSGKEPILKVKCEGEKVVEAGSVPYSEMVNDNRIKTVRDVVMKFVEDSATPDERPEVEVTELKTVTKEATNRKDIFTANLERQFKDNMIHIDTILEDTMETHAD